MRLEEMYLNRPTNALTYALGLGKLPDGLFYEAMDHKDKDLFAQMIWLHEQYLKLKALYEACSTKKIGIGSLASYSYSHISDMVAAHNNLVESTKDSTVLRPLKFDLDKKRKNAVEAFNHVMDRY
jgi:hypothetical protein